MGRPRRRGLIACCAAPAPGDTWLGLEAGIDAADDMLRAAGYEPVDKAVGILTRQGYNVATRALLKLIARSTSAPDRLAYTRAARELDRDWGNLTPAKRDAVIKAAAGSLLKVPPIVIPQVKPAIEAQASKVIEATRRATGDEFGLQIEASLSAFDDRVAAYAARSQAAYVTDVYGNRAEAFSARARGIVAEGLEKGLGRDELGATLAERLIEPGLRTAESYWRMVAAVHTTRARSWGQLSAYQEAAIEEYVWMIVDDEATCDVCDFLDGQTFSVGDAARSFADVEEADDPQDVEELQPWIRQAQDDSGRSVLFVEAGGDRHVLAHVDRSREGEKDTSGRYSRAASPARLQGLGIGSPPAHGGCRCTTAPA